ncbi:hypothetical protein FOCC_FOCC006056 [Frankliniella occidentalis]|uniref:Forkhead box protein N4 n=1 Tax=Frankliniella occidentalis TaxID=133901 RepID=A0A6J1TEN4_FRAOC|nr:forkhead box protein N4 [Frankliniella occidentalis]XP_026290176.1 forkhead box protein N4 [Frankliniella occidentalis]KAE8747189.1 hypothetical protein FOCC_FOCC006056 [Frankliniella occidentalis]
MDLYLGQDSLSLSLQDMLDCDIKSEMDSVLAGTDLGAHCLNLPPLDLDEDSLGVGAHMWFSANSNSSNSNFNLDFVGGDGAAMMVNPNSVMPLTLVTTMSSTPTPHAARSPSSTSSSPLPSPSASPSPPPPPSPPAPSYVRTVSNFATAATLAPRALSNGTQSRVVSSVRIAPASSTVSSAAVNGSAKLHKQVHHLSNGRHQVQAKKYAHNNNKYSDSDLDNKAYPKPAYSYSCLIAMALKNSKSGSLPVSDIYSFMCEHFPYFKTAPNGWKNSVRHNLSLNKCFEKIEKPAGNGSQRKGCLWAMNPAKIAKMDDEVQKWSRKDPMAIKKAMIFPENLELLERGEMKMTSRADYMQTNGDDTETSDEEVDEDVDEDDGTGAASSEDDVDTEMELDSQSSGFLINNMPDSFEESSLTDFDIEGTEGIYDELDVHEPLKVRLTQSKNRQKNTVITMGSATMRRTQSDPDRQDGYDFDFDEEEFSGRTIQGNYIYKVNGSFTTTTTSGSRRKQPLLVRATGPSVI